MFSVGNGRSDVGRSRKNNEDAFFVDEKAGLYVVSDGMGGQAGGEIASNLAVEVAVAHIERERAALPREAPAAALPRIVGEAVERACAAVYERAEDDRSLTGMGCTMTLLVVDDNRAVMGHVGDSRLYLVRGPTVEQLSNDHTLANELAQAGAFTAEEAQKHPYAHILSRAVGTKPTVQVDTLSFDVLPGDRFLICSDGLADYIEEPDWVGQTVRGGDFAKLPDELVAFANEAGGRDNITAVVLEVRAAEPEIGIIDEMTLDVTSRYAALSRVFLFEDLSLKLLTRVLGHCQQRVMDVGETVIREGDPCAQLMVVVSGEVAVTVADRAAADGVLTPGQHVGAPTLMNPRPARATLIANTRSSLLVLDRQHFWRLVRARPWLGINLLERLGRRLALDLDESMERRDDGDPTTTPLDPEERL